MAVLEKDFAKQVEGVLNLFGWLWKHDLPAVRQSGHWSTAYKGASGFPDYIAVRGDRVVCAEIKNEKGRVSKDQKIWIDALKGSDKVEVYVWRPNDLEQIIEILR